MDVLHHNLETVEELRLGVLHLSYKVLGEVFVYDAIGGSEKRQDMLDEVALVVVEFFVPIDDVRGQVNLLCRPEARFGFLVKVPDVVVLNREQDKSVGVVFENGFSHHRILGQDFFNGSLHGRCACLVHVCSGQILGCLCAHGGG